ncbi:MAG TPA: aspartate 1-decarboxylase [Terriglobia bacterium]|nr:aspartate 1-decarboxylase [Terriglobia bacterium]
MLRNFLRCKIHGATVTEANVDYIGSLAIDEEIMRLAGIEENEVVQVANLTNGERLTTYAIRAPAGSRAFGANGAAAHKIRRGDRIIVFAFAMYAEDEIEAHKPNLVFVDEANNPVAGPARETFAETY